MQQYPILHRLQLDDILRHVGLVPRATLLGHVLLNVVVNTLIEMGAFTALIQHAIVLTYSLFTLPAHLRLVRLVLTRLHIMKVVLILMVAVGLLHLRVSHHLVRCADEPFGTRVMRLHQNVLGISSVGRVPLPDFDVVDVGVGIVRGLFLCQVVAISRLLYIDGAST